MTPVITVEHLHKRYGDAVAVDDVSFAVEQGEIFGIIGPNGAGKTTTVESIEGLRVPDRGRPIRRCDAQARSTMSTAAAGCTSRTQPVTQLS